MTVWGENKHGWQVLANALLILTIVVWILSWRAQRWVSV